MVRVFPTNRILGLGELESLAREILYSLKRLMMVHDASKGLNARPAHMPLYYTMYADSLGVSSMETIVAGQNPRPPCQVVAHDSPLTVIDTNAREEGDEGILG
jgi:hypothetical protein